MKQALAEHYLNLILIIVEQYAYVGDGENRDKMSDELFVLLKGI